MIKIYNNKECKKILEDDKLFRSDGGLNTAWIHNRAKNYDFSELEGESLSEKLYLLYHSRPTCAICGKPTHYMNWSNGYNATCSPECFKVLNHKWLKEKTFSAMHSESAKAKRKQTNLKKYGVENVFANKDIQKKIKETNLQKYGVEHPAQNEEIRQKAVNTNLEKYNVSCYTQTKEYKQKADVTRVSNIDAFEKEHNCICYQKLINQYGQGWLSLGLPKLSFGRYKFVSNDLLGEIQKHYEETIEQISHVETEIYEYCKGLLPNEEILLQNRQILKDSSIEDCGKELDIYIPSKHLAIEYNGIYWHSFRDKNYHLNKTKACEELGIRLIHVWEDLWTIKKDIYKSIIASALGIYERKLYARNCICKEISNSDYEDFLIANHIQGAVKSSLRLGLYYNGELVQVAGWGKSRFKKGDYELHRMCSKLHTQVIGGFSKLIKHSNLNTFISYVDRDIYNGKGYLSCGFNIVGYTTVGYFYKNSNMKAPRINRISVQKHKLKSFLKKYDESLTETENMTQNGYLKVYNCGNIIVNYNK